MTKPPPIHSWQNDPRWQQELANRAANKDRMLEEWKRANERYYRDSAIYRNVSPPAHWSRSRRKRAIRESELEWNRRDGKLIHSPPGPPPTTKQLVGFAVFVAGLFTYAGVAFYGLVRSIVDDASKPRSTPAEQIVEREGSLGVLNPGRAGAAPAIQAQPGAPGSEPIALSMDLFPTRRTVGERDGLVR